MIILNKKVANDAILALWEVAETQEELLEKLNNDPVIVEKIAQFGSEKRRLEFLATRVLLNEVLNDKKTIAYEKSGKPYLADHSYNISITHTGKYVAILLHPICAVGIDIEKNSDRVERIKSKFLSEFELNFVEERSAKTQLTLMWSAKEALYKIVGKESVDFVNDLHIDVFQTYLEGEMEATESCTPQQENYEINYQVFPEFVLVWIVK